MSSSPARGIGTLLGQRPPVTFSIRAEGSRSSGEDIVSPGAVQVPNKSTTKRSEAPNPSAIVPSFLFFGSCSRHRYPRRAFVNRCHPPFPPAVTSIGIVVPRVSGIWQTVQLKTWFNRTFEPRISQLCRVSVFGTYRPTIFAASASTSRTNAAGFRPRKSTVKEGLRTS
jgi:hypothetical protein